jgi:hypothetical protein
MVGTVLHSPDAETRDALDRLVASGWTISV